MTTEHDDRINAYLRENGQMHAAINQLASEFEEQIGLHLIDQEDLDRWAATYPLEPSPTQPGEIVVRHLHTAKPIAVIHKDGTTTRVDQPEEEA